MNIREFKEDDIIICTTYIPMFIPKYNENLGIMQDYQIGVRGIKNIPFKIIEFTNTNIYLEDIRNNETESYLIEDIEDGWEQFEFPQGYDEDNINKIKFL